MKIRLSHSQAELYNLCGRKYFYRYRKKLRAKEKGSALFFGSAFDEATGHLLEHRNLDEAKELFQQEWLRHEDNTNVKFSKSDYTDVLLTPNDISRLEMAALNLENTKAVQEYKRHEDVLLLIKDIRKLAQSDYARNLNDKEEKFIHFANMLAMNRKGMLMLESFNDNIIPHVTKVHSVQQAINIEHPDGHTVIGYIDLLCEMEGYKISDKRTLKANEIVVADIKSAGPTAWKKHDNIQNSQQLDTYLVDNSVRDLVEEVGDEHGNVIAYFVTSKSVQKDEQFFCESCGAKKESRHKTCSAEVDGKRCGGNWRKEVRYFCDSKIVIAERDLEDAQMIFNDFEDILTGVLNNVFPRNRNSCEAFGGICEFKDICGKNFKNPEQVYEQWKKEKGE